MTIVEMTHSDIDDVLAFWKQIDNGVGLSESDCPEGMKAFLLRNPGLSLLARDEKGSIIAAVQCGHDGRRGYLYHLAVSPEHQMQGLGRDIVERCLEVLRGLGVHKCTIHVYVDNEVGQRFWKGCGWATRTDLKVMQGLSGKGG